MIRHESSTSTVPDVERRLRALVASGGEGVALIGADLRYEYVSPTVARILGRPVSELVAQPSGAFVHPDDQPRFREWQDALIATPGATESFLSRTHVKDGEWRWVAYTATNLIADPGVHGVVAQVRDLTDHVRTLEELREMKTRLETLLSSTSAMIYTCRAEPPYGATFISENIRSVLGYPPQALLEQPGFWVDHIHPADRDRILSELGELFTLGRHVHEYRFRHADGSYRWMHDDLVLVRDDVGKPREMIGCFHDVTTRREAEEAQNRAVVSFRALVECLPAGVLVHRDDRIVYANTAVVSLLGFSCRDELIGLSPLDVVPEPMKAHVRDRIARLVELPGNPSNRNTELGVVRRDGVHVPVQVDAVKIDFDGAPSICVMLVDLTERRRLVSRLAVSDRLVSVGTLAAGVAHEINNPLAFVLTNLTILEEAIPALADDHDRARLEASDVQGLLRDAREGALRIRSVVRDLRSLSRSEEDTVGPVDVRHVLEFCLRMTHNEIRHRARLVQSFEEVPPVEGNESRLAQVFMNLIINAAQAMDDGNAGRNELGIRVMPDAAGNVVVAIADTGCGIPADMIGRIFDPFFTTKPVGVGTGLGLAISHGIVRGMNGEIQVESTPGRGSTFRVVLPASARSLAEPSPAVPEPHPTTRRRRILVVDDEPAFGTTVRVLLGGEHDVVATTRAVDALARITAGERFDLILSDLMMPEMSGMQFYAEVQRLVPSIAPRIVFMTGGAFTEAARAFLERVPNVRLEKPFDPDALRGLVRDVANGSELPLRTP